MSPQEATPTNRFSSKHLDAEWSGVFQRDAHFLQRLDRLSSSQLELALGLYRDSELVKALLGDLRLGEVSPRVAISIDDKVRGPFIVVTREGQFVTCLGAGMCVSVMPVLSKEHFDQVARKMQR